MKNKRIRIFAVLFIALTFLASASLAYGASSLYSVRDEKIEIELPDEWTIVEEDVSNSEGMAEKILTASVEQSNYMLDLNVFFIKEDTDDYIYFLEDKPAAMYYYDTYGKDIVEEFYADRGDYELLSLSEPEVYDGEWISFLKITATVQNAGGPPYEELIYLTAANVTVHKLLIFSTHDQSYGAAEIEAAAEPIVESFYDYGYDEEMLGISEEDEPEQSGNAGPIIMALYILIPIIVIGTIIAKGVAKSKSKRKETDGLHIDKAQSINTNTNRKTKDRAGKWKAAGKAAFSNSKTSDTFKTSDTLEGKLSAKDRSHSPDTLVRSAEQRTIHSDAGTKYVECLKTLHKSGLLTKEELREMIDKYEGRR